MKKRFVSLIMAAAMTATALTGCGNTAQTPNGGAEQDNAAAADQNPDEVQDSGDNTQIDDTDSAKAASASDGNVTELTFWYSWTDKIQENNIALTDKFNETVGKEKGIHVTAEYQGSYDDLHQKLQAAYVAGDTPDVTVMEIASIRTFAENGVLEPLDSYIEQSGIDMSDFYEGLMQNSYIDGPCYGIPYLRSTPIMYMNKTLLDEAGLDADKMNTWDDLKTYITTVHDKTGKYGMSMWSYVWPFEAFMKEHGTSMLSEDEKTSNMGGQEAKDIVNFFNDLKDSGAVHIYTKADSEKVKTDVMNQDTAIWYGSTGDFTYYNQVAADCGFDLGCCFIPKDKSYGVTSGGCNLIMSSSIPDERKAAAWEFIQWMTSTEQTITASKNTGYLPSRKSAADSDEMNELYQQIPQYKVALDQLEYSTGRPMNPGYVEAANEVEKALDAMWVNDADVDSTLADLKSKMDKLLNE